MRIEIELDDALLAEAMQVSGITDLEELIRVALKVLIAQNRRKSLLDLEGKIQFAPGYQYKQLR
ncbi:MAG TPA: type II toxin-antitoxin system VapB family antitoxin [Thermoanaerobaculia bacterium]|jgi:Arc/MetJ family transcription regulator|nr:type II toxin-antitoxin system VapB family antitoxin [Thermoanaerobaculia bacterium]